MKFKTTTVEIKKALQVLSPIVNHNHATLAYRYILLRKKSDDTVEIKAYDDYTVGSAFIKVYDITEESNENAYVLGKHFMGLIGSFAKDEIIIDVKENKCKITCGKSKYTLKTLDKEVASINLPDVDYYSYLEKDFKSKIKIKDFKTAYSSVSHCISKDSSQRDLQNIFLVDSQIVACNGIMSAVTPFDTTGLEGITLHKKICDCVLNINNTADIQLLYSENKVYGKTDTFIFCSSISEDYPYTAIQPLITDFNETEATVILEFDPEEVIDKLNRVLMFADSDTHSVNISADKNELVFFVENDSNAKETINVFKNISGANLNLLIDGASFKEALSKTLAEVKWITNDSDSVQYIYDGNVLQFFLGLSS